MDANFLLGLLLSRLSPETAAFVKAVFEAIKAIEAAIEASPITSPAMGNVKDTIIKAMHSMITTVVSPEKVEAETPAKAEADTPAKVDNSLLERISHMV